MKAFFQWLAATDWFMRAGPRFVPRMDRLVHRLTGGRLVSSGLVPALILVSTGAKSGLPRRTPLACLPEADGGLLVVGSNFGLPAHPAWTFNLLAEPRATVSFRGRDLSVTAALLTGDERALAWPGLLELWPVYARYTEKSGRELRVFRLTPGPVTRGQRE
ncbi:nitroreductase family deazaflavin-dependent oxidoreductase [Nonomuraea sp. NBC_01738]|uniref:nitroreductase family deazaflavin-dependent oxidoreductase n=1 Tax=Nonomuraea sp. NBC_01738 TaxID=2976003 RepID=UPI002E140843|nr:nitroreductase family deazaflavin-dependent oxidoreductase [Nonomuraea sp. NBC_01738]